MKNLIDQTIKDIEGGQQSWRVLIFGSVFSFVATLVVLAFVNA